MQVAVAEARRLLFGHPIPKAPVRNVYSANGLDDTYVVLSYVEERDCKSHGVLRVSCSDALSLGLSDIVRLLLPPLLVGFGHLRHRALCL